MNVIVDTSGWYAGTVADDLHHEEAKSFLTASHELIIPAAVFIETAALLQNRRNKKLAIQSAEAMRTYGILELNEEEHEEAWKLYQRTSASISYVDCTVISLAKKNDLPVFGFDSHFQKLGVKTVP